MAHQVVPVDLPASQRITPAQLKEKMAKENVYVVDVRNPSEIKSSIKTSSINIPINVVETALKLSDADFKAQYGASKPPSDGSNVVFHCMKGARGSVATDLAAKLGLVKAQNLEGGMKNWIESGFAD